jgi:hypothetical protein
MKKGLIIETRVISEIRRQRELMGLKPVVLNEAAERIPFLNRVIKWIVGNAPETKLSDMLGGNAPQIMKRLQKLGINSIETLEKNLFDEAGTATRKIPTDVEKSIIKAFRKKVFTDPDLADLAKESVVDYFDRLGNLSNGVSVSETIENLLSADFTIPDVRKAADDLIAQLELRFGKDNEAVQYVKKSTEMKKVDNAFDDIDVNGPKVDDTNTPEPEPFFKPDEPININGSEAPNPDDIKFDFGGNNYPDPEKLPDLEIDFGAAYRAMQVEPERVPETLANLIKTMADKTPLFKGLPEDKKIKVIEQLKSQFVILYNKEVKDATAQILGEANDPKVLAQIEKAWKSVTTSPSAKQALLDKALKDSDVKLSMYSKQYWKNYATGKSASTGADIGPKQWFKNYIQAAAVSAGFTVIGIIMDSIDGYTNIGWDNLPGDTDGEKVYTLIKPGEAFFKASLPPFMGSLLLTLGVDRLFINKYRKPSANEIREKLLIKNEAAIEVKDVPASNYKDAEYSRTILIDGINVGDWTLEIETKKLVAMKKGNPIPEDAKTGSTGNTPTPTPTPAAKTTMTRAEVEAKAVSSTHGYVAPIRFTPNEDNKDSYDGIDKDGYKFIAKLVSGEIAITSNGKE